MSGSHIRAMIADSSHLRACWTVWIQHIVRCHVCPAGPCEAGAAMRGEVEAAIALRPNLELEGLRLYGLNHKQPLI